MPTLSQGFKRLRQWALDEPDYTKGEPLSYGELGTVQHPTGGGFSTEIMTGVQDPRLYSGRQTNIPMLVQGQQDIPSLLSGNRPTNEQYDIAVKRAMARVAQGQQFPNFATPEEADTDETRRHRILETLIRQWRQ